MKKHSHTGTAARRVTALVLLAGLIATIAAPAALAKQAAKPLTQKQVIALIKKYSKAGATGKTGPAGVTGPAGPTGPTGPSGTPAPAYSAGAGITLLNNVFSVNPASVQTRVGSCGSSAEVIFGIAQNGALTCGYAAEIESAQTGSNKPITGGTQLAVVGIAPGSSFFTAATTLENSSSSPVLVQCFVDDNAANTLGESDTVVPAKFGSTSGAASVAVQGYATVTANDDLTFECGTPTTGVISTESGVTTNLTALAVGSASVLTTG